MLLDPYPDPHTQYVYGSYWAFRIRKTEVRMQILPSSSKNSKENLYFDCFVTYVTSFMTFYLRRMMRMYLQRVIRKKKTRKKSSWRSLKKSGIRGRIRKSEVWIQIHIEKSLIQNTAFFSFYPLGFPLYSNAMHPTLLEMLLKWPLAHW